MYIVAIVVLLIMICGLLYKYTQLDKQLSVAIEKNKDIDKIPFLQQELQLKVARCIELETELKLAEENKKTTADLMQQVKNEVNAMSLQLMQQNRQATLEESKNTLNAILAPLNNNFSEFKTKIDTETKEVAALKASLNQQLSNVMLAVQNTNNNAIELTKALRGESKTRGDWGESILEKILQDCGLRKNQTYFTQENLKDENEKNIRPDVIVKLPDNKCIVIDAKVTLNAYQDYCNCEDENLKAQHAKKFQQDIERTLKDLSSKEYHKYVQNDTIESVVMFIPIEPAYILALQQDPNLFARAIEKRVIIASPYNIMAILKIVDIMWQVQKYNKNSEEIAKQGGDLIDKFQDLLGRIADLEKSFNGVTNNFSAIKTSIEGKGNLLYKVKELKRLGVVASKKPDKTSDLLTQFHDEDDLTSSTATAAPIDTLL